MATININGADITSLAELSTEMGSMGLHLCLVQETHIPGDITIHNPPEWDIPNDPDSLRHRLINVGPPTHSPRAGQDGVGIMISDQLFTHWQALGRPAIPNREYWGTPALTGRVLAVRLPLQPYIHSLTNREDKKDHLWIISVYAPTEASPAELCQDFYDGLVDLVQYIKQIEPHDIVILAGDFNAHVGAKQRDDPPGIGPHTRFPPPKRNQNGARLVEMCRQLQYDLVSTHYKHKPAHTITFIRTTDRTEPEHVQLKNGHILDYFIAPSFLRTQNRIYDSRTYPEAHKQISGADHRMVLLCFRNSQAYIRPYRHPLPKPTQVKTLRLNLTTDRTEKIQNYQKDIGELIQSQEYQNADTMTRPTILTEGMRQIATRTICTTPETSKPWINDEARKAIDEYHTAYKRQKQNPQNPVMLQELKDARKAKKTVVTDAKHEHIRTRTADMNTAAQQHNMTQIYKITDNLTGRDAKTPQGSLRGPEGQEVTDPQDMVELVANHYKVVFNQPPLAEDPLPSTPLPPITPTPTAPTPPPNPPAPPPPPDPPPQINRAGLLRFTYVHVEAGLKRLKNNKAADATGTNAELFKLSGKDGTTTILDQFNDILEQQKLPPQWRTTTIKPIPKTTNPKVCKDLRPISIVPMYMKLLACMLLIIIETHVDQRLLPIHAGFRKGHSLTDLVWTIAQCIEEGKRLHKDIHIIFLDIQQAYDAVPRNPLWRIMREAYEIPTEIVGIIELLYQLPEAKVIFGGMESQQFDLSNGLKQGCLLSPLLFLIYLDYVVRETSTLIRDLGVRWTEADTTRFILNLLFYADDGAVLAESHEDMVRIINLIHAQFHKYGLRLSIPKCKYMPCVFSKNPIPPTPIVIGEQTIDVVEFYKYLGTILTHDGSYTRNITHRIIQARQTFERLALILTSKRLTRQTRYVLYRASVLACLLHNSQVWTPSKPDLQKLEGFQHECLLRMDSHSRRAHLTKDEMRERFDAKTITDLLRTNRGRWEGHIRRMHDPNLGTPCTRIPYTVFYASLERPQPARRASNTLTWRKQIYQDHDALGMPSTEHDLDALAAKRPEWRDIIHRPTFNTERKALRTCPFCRQLLESVDRCVVHICESQTCTSMYPRDPLYAAHIACERKTLADNDDGVTIPPFLTPPTPQGLQPYLHPHPPPPQVPPGHIPPPPPYPPAYHTTGMLTYPHTHPTLTHPPHPHWHAPPTQTQYIHTHTQAQTHQGYAGAYPAGGGTQELSRGDTGGGATTHRTQRTGPIYES
jgi:hypothetical protein